MRPTRSRPLLLGAAVIAIITWLGLRSWSSTGHELPALPWTAPAVMALMAAAVLVAGVPVRRWTRGARTEPLDPLVAARTVVLAKSAQYAGALLTGWYAGQAVVLLSTLDVEPRRSLLLRALISVATAVAVWVAGWLVERFCRVDRRGQDDRTPPGASRTG